MFITDDQVKSALAAALQTTASGLGSHWTSEIVPQAHSEAYQDIVNILTGRGFTLAQITSWDQGAQVERLHSVYYCLLNGGATAASGAAAKEFDQTKKLQSMASLCINSVWKKPANTDDQPGMVGTGSFNTSDDMFVPFDPDDSRRGEVTRW